MRVRLQFKAKMISLSNLSKNQSNFRLLLAERESCAKNKITHTIDFVLKTINFKHKEHDLFFNFRSYC